MLSRADIKYDPATLEQELNSLIKWQDDYISKVPVKDNGVLNEFKIALSSPNEMVKQLGKSKIVIDPNNPEFTDRMAYYQRLKLQLLVRGAQVSADNNQATLAEAVKQLDKEQVKDTMVQGADEECRAADMYGYVSAVKPTTAQQQIDSDSDYEWDAEDDLPLFRVNASSSPMRLRSHSTTFHTHQQDAVTKMQDAEPSLVHKLKSTGQQSAQATEPLTRKLIIEHQKADPVFAKIIHLLTKRKNISATDRLLSEIATRNYELQSDGALVKLWHADQPGLPREALVIPDSLVQRAIHACHEDNHSAHQGFMRTYQNVKDRFWWVGMYSDVQRHVRTCPVCQLKGRAPPAAPIAGHITANEPGEAWVMDVLHMPESENGFEHVFVAVDVFSRYVVLAPMKENKSSEVVNLAELHIIGGPGGIPKWVLTDGGSEFKLHFKDFCKRHHIEHKVSTPRHAASHGMVERCIATVSLMFSHFLDDDLSKWDSFVPYVTLAHNSTPHPAITSGLKKPYKPCELFLGRVIRNEVDRQIMTNLPHVSPETYYKEAQELLELSKTQARKHMQEYHAKMEATKRNQQRIRRDLDIGSLVKFHQRPTQKKLAKLGRDWKGPYRVVNISDDSVNLTLRHVGGGKLIETHLDFVKGGFHLLRSRYMQRGAS